MTNRQLQTSISSLTPEGKGKADHNGKPLYVIGAVPGETVEAFIVKKRKGYREAVVEKVLTASPHRHEPREDHFLSCSPWQTIDYEYQIEQKRKMLNDAFEEYAAISVTIDEFYASTITEGYRNKMEFSFWNEDNQMYLAFHKRGSPFIKTIAPEGCILGSKRVNEAALAIVKKLNELQIPKKDLKTITLRESKTTGDIIAILLQSNPELTINLTLNDLKGLVEGVIIATSNPLSPASLIEEIGYQEGITHLEETFSGFTFAYPYDGFFQNNIPMFEIALERMNEHTFDCNKLVELYSGVGTIGLTLHDKAKTVYGVEIIPSAVEFAEKNAKRNNVDNYIVAASPSEKMTAVLTDADIVILDPPRSGLHPDVIKALLDTAPKRIIYLSCNPSTQARDYALLKGTYSISKLYGFDFYPHALHLESLAILDRQN